MSVDNLAVRANTDATTEDKLSDEELLGQISYVCILTAECEGRPNPCCSELVFAATDTTSNSLARTLQLLAEHPEVQDKLRAEIVDATHDGQDIPYDTLIALPYLDAVCRETLRV